MAKIVCVANPVRGAGRTSSAVNLAASLSLLEKKVLIIDCDPIKKASSSFGFTHDNYDYGLDDLLTGFVGGKGVVAKSSFEYLDVIPAGHGLDEIEDNLAYNPDKEGILGIIIKKFREDYDFIIFDTPGDDGLLTKSALIASDEILVPLKCDFQAVETLHKLLAMIKEVTEKFKSHVQMGGVLFTFCETISAIEDFLSPDVVNEFKGMIYETTIPESSLSGLLDTSPTKPVCLIDLKSDIADSFLNVAFEFLSREALPI